MIDPKLVANWQRALDTNLLTPRGIRTWEQKLISYLSDPSKDPSTTQTQLASIREAMRLARI